MAESLFDKATNLVVGNMHDLLDGLAELNTTSAVRQRIRNLEIALDKLKVSTSKARGGLGLVTTDIADLTAKIKQDESHAEFIANDGDDTNDHVALKILEGVEGLQTQLTSLKENNLKAAQTTLTALESSLSKVTQAHAKMVNKLVTLENMEKSTKAKEQAASAVTAAAKLAEGATGEVSVDNFEQKLKRRAAEADAALNDSLQSVSATTEVETTIEQIKAKQKLAALKAKKAGTTAA